MKPSNSGSIHPPIVQFQRSCRKAHQWRQRCSNRTPSTVYEAERPLLVEQMHFNADNQGVKMDGGEGGIRTPGTRKRTIDFESTALDHSATSPKLMGKLKNGLQRIEKILQRQKKPIRSCNQCSLCKLPFINCNRY